MSSSSTEEKEALGCVLARTLSSRPSSDPRKSTVRSFPGPADVSTVIWVSLYLGREEEGGDKAGGQEERKRGGGGVKVRREGEEERKWR